MNKIFNIFLSIIFVLAFVGSTAMAGDCPKDCKCDKCMNVSDAGKVGLVFVFNGLSELGVSPFNGGIGAKYYLADKFALRGSVGGYYKKNDETSTNQINLTGAALWEILKSKNTAGYFGGEIGYTNTKTEETVNQFSIAGIVGAEFEVFNNVALGAEYKVLYAKQSNPDAWGISFANNTTAFLLNIYF